MGPVALFGEPHRLRHRLEASWNCAMFARASAHVACRFDARCGIVTERFFRCRVLLSRMTERVFITGASGFVAQELIRSLRDDEVPVIAASRREMAESEGLEVCRTPDLTADMDWSDALAGAGAVIHLAARVHVGNGRAQESPALYSKVNTFMTRRLAEDAARAGMRCFIFLSTVKVHGESSATSLFAESQVPDPQLPYEISKLEAERAVAEVAARTGMACTILRPPLVYGPGVKGNFLSLLRLVDRALPLPLGAIENRRSLIYVGNLVSAIRCALSASTSGCHTYLLRDGEDLSSPELVRRLARALGRPARLPRVPVRILVAAGKVLRREAEMVKIVDSLVVDDSLIRRELGWSPPFSVDQGLKKTAEWYHANPQY